MKSYLIVMFESRSEVAKRFTFTAYAKALESLAQIIATAAQCEREKFTEGVHLIVEPQIAVQSARIVLL